MKKGCIVSKLRSQNDTRGIACVSCWRNARAAVGADIIRPRRMQLPFASITTHSQSVILRRRAGREAPACGILLSVRGGRRATRPTAKPESMRFRRRMARFRVRPARAVGDASPYEAPIETGCRAGACAPPSTGARCGGPQVAALHRLNSCGRNRKKQVDNCHPQAYTSD